MGCGSSAEENEKMGETRFLHDDIRCNHSGYVLRKKRVTVQIVILYMTIDDATLLVMYLIHNTLKVTLINNWVIAYECAFNPFEAVNILHASIKSGSNLNMIQVCCYSVTVLS